jgi:hypothetical protein
MMSYALKNKDAETVLREIKKFFLCFGVPKIFQTDNGGNLII